MVSSNPNRAPRLPHRSLRRVSQSRPREGQRTAQGHGISTVGHRMMKLKCSPSACSDQALDKFVGLVTIPGGGIVDTAAEEGCIGHSSLSPLASELAKHGLQWLWDSRAGDNHAAATCSGIGGAATWMGTVLVPCGIGGVHGIIKLHVLDERESKSIP